MARIATIAVLLLATAAASAQADLAAPSAWSYQVVSPRGRARLVQRCQGPGACVSEAFDAARRSLWSVPVALGPLPAVGIADDGVHVVRVNPLLPEEAPGEAEAFAVFARGALVRRWLARELVDRPGALPAFAGGRRWMAEWRFTDDGRSLEIRFVNGERRAYALATGLPR